MENVENIRKWRVKLIEPFKIDLSQEIQSSRFKNLMYFKVKCQRYLCKDKSGGLFLILVLHPIILHTVIFGTPIFTFINIFQQTIGLKAKFCFKTLSVYESLTDQLPLKVQPQNGDLATHAHSCDVTEIIFQDGNTQNQSCLFSRTAKGIGKRETVTYTQLHRRTNSYLYNQLFVQTNVTCPYVSLVRGFSQYQWTRIQSLSI